MVPTCVYCCQFTGITASGACSYLMTGVRDDSFCHPLPLFVLLSRSADWTRSCPNPRSRSAIFLSSPSLFTWLIKLLMRSETCVTFSRLGESNRCSWAPIFMGSHCLPSYRHQLFLLVALQLACSVVAELGQMHLELTRTRMGTLLVVPLQLSCSVASSQIVEDYFAVWETRLSPYYCESIASCD